MTYIVSITWVGLQIIDCTIYGVAHDVIAICFSAIDICSGGQEITTA